MVGGKSAGLTVNIAAFVAAVPAELMNTARNREASSLRCAVNEYDVDIAPMMSDQTLPSELDCHWTSGIGEPLAEAVNDTVTPSTTVRSAGWVRITGGVSGAATVSI